MNLCPRCGTLAREGWAVCAVCGASLAADASPPPDAHAHDAAWMAGAPDLGSAAAGWSEWDGPPAGGAPAVGAAPAQGEWDADTHEPRGFGPPADFGPDPDFRPVPAFDGRDAVAPTRSAADRAGALDSAAPIGSAVPAPGATFGRPVGRAAWPDVQPYSGPLADPAISSLGVDGPPAGPPSGAASPQLALVPTSELGGAHYRDTGRGWRILLPGHTRRLEAGASRTGWLSRGRRTRILPGEPLPALDRLSRTALNVLLLSIILAILAIPVIIGILRIRGLREPIASSGAMPTVAPVPTAYPGSHTFRSTLFTLSVPDAWAHVSTNADFAPGGVAQEDDFSGPAQSYATFVVVTLPSVPIDQLDPLLSAAVVAYVQAHGIDLQPTTTPQPGRTLDGAPTLQERFTFAATATQGTVALQGTALGLNRGLLTCIVIYAAPAGRFDATTQRDFAPMLASLRLQSPSTP